MGVSWIQARIFLETCLVKGIFTFHRKNLRAGLWCRGQSHWVLEGLRHPGATDCALVQN